MFHVKHTDCFSIEEFKKLLKNYLDIELSLESQERFSLYLNELSSWNKKINLISRKKDKPEDIYRHFLDSLLIFKALQIPQSSKIMDLGSGAGFPAIPMKILREDLDITLVESIRKKTLFLKKMIELLGLKDITVFQERIEKLPELQGFKESFDFVTAKAFGKVKDTINNSYPFLKQGGILVAYKGSSYKTEIIELLEGFENLKLQIKDIKFFEIPEIDLRRFFVLIEKIS
ncbi:MAG: 16S rRNA (guanine(527)-N(7))-methyltransferase RsmG [Candidatus Zixiibacteriota bacterium]